MADRYRKYGVIVAIPVSHHPDDDAAESSYLVAFIYIVTALLSYRQQNFRPSLFHYYVLSIDPLKQGFTLYKQTTQVGYNFHLLVAASLT